MESKRVAIVGAGLSGLLACKYVLEKGFDPIVFEASDSVGGVWAFNTIQSTKLQNIKEAYQFTDFPWPSSVKDLFPSHTQVLDYLKSYVDHFDLYPCIKFNHRVTCIDYAGVSNEEIESWDLWNGTGKPFGSKGKWQLDVQHTKNCSLEVYEVEFVILCIGRFSGLPNVPKFPPNQGPEDFNGKVMHSMDYSAMDNASAAEFIKKKRIVVVGSSKSALDITAECADANGPEYPCTMIQRTPNWFLPSAIIWGINIGFLCFNRFAELLVHKPGETFLHSCLAALLLPLKWCISKFVESYTMWKVPMKKHGVLPKHGFLESFSFCQFGLLPDNFYKKVEEGSIILKRIDSFNFCGEGLNINGETNPIEADIVILATGYKSEQKLKDIFKSTMFKDSITGPPSSPVSLYRQIIHPRIPQLAIIGHAEFAVSNMLGYELKSKWLANYLDGFFELPSIGNMKKDILIWEKHMKQYAGKNAGRSCISSSNIWYIDQLCKDMGYNPWRKKGFFAEWFQPYGPKDYAHLTRE